MGIRLSTDIKPAAASKTLSAPEMTPECRANLKGTMKALVRVLKTVGDTFLKVFTTSFSISMFTGNQSNKQYR